MPVPLARAVLVAISLFVATSARAQWVPGGALKSVPVISACNETAGDVAASRLDPPTVYLCPHVMALVRKKDPGAEHFYFVHEFGHIALQTADEAAADCWAAQQLAKAPNGRRYLDAAIRHFLARPDEASRLYGSPRERAERIRRCADEANPSGPGAG